MAEREGFEPPCRLPDKTLSRRPRYDHFGTSPLFIRSRPPSAASLRRSLGPRSPHGSLRLLSLSQSPSTTFFPGASLGLVRLTAHSGSCLARPPSAATQALAPAQSPRALL